MNLIRINCNIGDWGLGIGDWANPQIPNPQSPMYLTIIQAFRINFKENILNKININNN
jgi:hypothetical protein